MKQNMIELGTSKKVPIKSSLVIVDYWYLQWYWYRMSGAFLREITRE